MAGEDPGHRRQLFSGDGVPVIKPSTLGADFDDLIECQQRRARQFRGIFAEQRAFGTADQFPTMK